MYLHVDFETRSASDIFKLGSHLYAKHPTTSVLCVGVANKDEKPQVLSPEGFGRYLTARRFSKSVPVIAHNAAFEIDIWNQCGTKLYGWPPLTVKQTDCTMVRAYAMGLPGSLADASAAVGIREGKDMGGRRIMLKLSKPRRVEDDGEIIWWPKDEVKDDYIKLYKYCAQDIEVERELDRRLRKLSPYEKEVWILDQKINRRGLRIDVNAATKALEIVEFEKSRLDVKMKEITHNQVASCTAVAQIQRLINNCGVECDSVAKDSLLKLLNKKEIPPVVKSVLLLRQEAAKSSNAKLKRMISSAQESDERIRGCFQYHAAATGRWGGRKIQPHNMPRGTLKKEQIEYVFGVLNGG